MNKTYAAEEVESRGMAIYEGKIRHLVEPGETVIIEELQPMQLQ